MKKLVSTLALSALALGSTLVITNCTDDDNSAVAKKETETAPLKPEVTSTHKSMLTESYRFLEVKMPNSRGGYDVFTADSRIEGVTPISFVRKGDDHKTASKYTYKKLDYKGSSVSRENLDELKKVEVEPELTAYFTYSGNTMITHYYEIPDNSTDLPNPTLKFYIIRNGTYGTTTEYGYEYPNEGHHALIDNSVLRSLADEFKMDERDMKNLLTEIYLTVKLNEHHDKDLSEEMEFIKNEIIKKMKDEEESNS